VFARFLFHFDHFQHCWVLTEAFSVFIIFTVHSSYIIMHFVDFLFIILFVRLFVQCSLHSEIIMQFLEFFFIEKVHWFNEYQRLSLYH
jgi:hypothetical protein